MQNVKGKVGKINSISWQTQEFQFVNSIYNYEKNIDCKKHSLLTHLFTFRHEINNKKVIKEIDRSYVAI